MNTLRLILLPLAVLVLAVAVGAAHRMSRGAVIGLSVVSGALAAIDLFVRIDEAP